MATITEITEDDIIPATPASETDSPSETLIVRNVASAEPELMPYKTIFLKIGKGMPALSLYYISGISYGLIRSVYCRETSELLEASPLISLSWRLLGASVQSMTNAVNSLVAEAIAKKQPQRVGDIFWQAHTMVFITNVPAMVTINFIGHLWTALGYSEGAVALVNEYNSAVLYVMPFVIIPNIHRMFAASAGLVTAGLISSGIGLTLPAVTYLMTFTFGWGLKGNALAPITYGVALMGYNFSYFLLKQRQQFGLWPIRMRESLPELKRLFNVGTQQMLVFLGESGGIFLRTLFASWVSRAAYLATSVVVQAESMMTILTIPYSQMMNATSAGAFNSELSVRYQNSLRVAKAGLLYGLIISGTTCAVFLAIPEAMVRWLVSENSPAFSHVFANAMPMFALSAGLLCADTARLGLTGYARGMNSQLATNVINIVGVSALSSLLGWVMSSHLPLDGELGLSLGYLLGTTLTAAGLFAYSAYKVKKVSEPVVAPVVENPQPSFFSRLGNRLGFFRSAPVAQIQEIEMREGLGLQRS